MGRLLPGAVPPERLGAVTAVIDGRRWVSSYFPDSTVAFYEPDRLFATDGPPGEAEFLRAPDGTIAWFRIGGRITSRV